MIRNVFVFSRHWICPLRAVSAEGRTARDTYPSSLQPKKTASLPADFGQLLELEAVGLNSPWSAVMLHKSGAFVTLGTFVVRSVFLFWCSRRNASLYCGAGIVELVCFGLAWKTMAPGFDQSNTKKSTQFAKLQVTFVFEILFLPSSEHIYFLLSGCGGSLGYWQSM